MQKENSSFISPDELKDIKIYNSTSQISTLFTDYANFIVMPLISFIGIITNLASFIVAFKLNKTNLMNLFILYDSFLNFVLSFVSLFIIIVRCGSLCPYGYKLESKIYDLYIFLYGKHTILFISHAWKGLVAWNSLFAFSTKKTRFKLSIKAFKLASLIVLVIGVSLQAFLISSSRFIRKFGVIFSKNAQNGLVYEFLYKVELRDFSTGMRILILCLLLLEDFILILILFIIDVLILVKFLNYSKSRNKKLVSLKKGEIIKPYNIKVKN